MILGTSGLPLSTPIALCQPATLILAFGYLYLVQRYYSGKVNVSKDNQGLY
jgi:hypothetical protein